MRLTYFYAVIVSVCTLTSFNACSEAPNTSTSENTASSQTNMGLVESALTSSSNTGGVSKADMLKQFEEAPREEMLQDAALWKELKDRYKENLSTLNDKINATGAKLVVMYSTPEIGESTTPAQREGRPFIEATCKSLGIDFVDVTTNLKGKKPEEITNMPVDGHFSKAGAQIIAGDVENIVKKNASHKATASYTERPKLMGDLQPNQDEVLDGGKNLPYRLKTNSQGLRMDFDLAFPKTKQRILFMGDSGFFFPFMDNKFTVNNLLQSKLADKEFINACNWGYAIDDYISLFEERTKFTEPDVVMIQTSGTDIMDMYFSHRNRFSRSNQGVQPSALEKAFYERTFKK